MEEAMVRQAPSMRQARSEVVTAMWYRVLWSTCLRINKELARDMTLTPHSARHLMSDVARRFQMNVDDRGELGRWSASAIEQILKAMGLNTQATKAVKGTVGAMQNLYSSGDAAMQREADLRAAVCRYLQQFLKGKIAWPIWVPLQMGVPPSWAFLKEEREMVPEMAEMAQSVAR